MKIGIISDRLNRQRTGIGNYIYNLINEFNKVPYKDNKIILINYLKNDSFPNLKQMIIKNPFYLFGNRSFYCWHVYLDAFFKIKDLDLDVIHSPENATPFSKLIPRKIITVHDITPYFFPESFSPLTLLRYKLLFSRAMKTSDRIIVDSVSTKNDIKKYFHIEQKKIKVIYLGVGDIFKRLDEEEVAEIKQKFKINFPFILYVGTIEPRKNIQRLLMAFSKVKKEHPKYKLVIAGASGWRSKNLLETINKFDLQKDVVFVGYVSDYELPALYNAADLFVYPSLYEGFGLPPLEAMACGCPVLTSNSSSLPEVVGKSAMMFNPYDLNELTNAMHIMITNEGLREDLIQKGLCRAKMFNWEKCSRETFKVYGDVVF